jgi:nickel superoxide dismutase
MKLIDSLIKFLPSKPVYAHCDIPCGIYDPHLMQMAAHTVIRMTKLLGEAGEDVHKISRITHVKEEHGKIVEEELGTLDVDYFKDEHFKEYPELQDLLKKTAKLSVKVRQEINMDLANELLANVQQIAEIFWKTKGFEPVRIPSGYPTEGEIVSHK